MKTSSIPSLFRLVPIGLILGFAPALQAQEELITPFMTLDWTFNTENLSAEFAVERIFDLQLGPQGELIVFGRDKIEVLDREGNPLCILRDDTGAEISSKSFGYVGPSGFITIIPNGSPDIGYVFSPDFVCMRVREYSYPSPWADLMAERDLNLSFLPATSITLSEETCVFTVRGHQPRTRERQDSPSEPWEALLLENQGIYHLIAAYSETGHIRTGSSTGWSSGVFGRLLYQALPGNKIVYTHGGHDRTISDDGATYTLRIFSLDDKTESVITHPYEPVAINAEELIGNIASIGGGVFDPDDPENRQRYRAFYEAVENRPFKTPIYNLFTDGTTIFAHTSSRDDSGGILIHVFDAGTGSFRCATIVPRPTDRTWRFSGVRNGYAYAISNSNGFDGPPAIERYRVNPAIYGR